MPGTPSHAFEVKDGIPFGPHPRCMITGCVSAEVEACYILPPDVPQRSIDSITHLHTDYNVLRCNMPTNIIFLRRDLRILWETNRLLMIPRPENIHDPDTRSAHKYHVIVEGEHPPDSCIPMGCTIIPSVTTVPCSYLSLGWHELNTNVRLMMSRAGQHFVKRPFHYQHVLSMDALVHIPTIRLDRLDAVDPAFSRTEQELPLEGTPRPPKRKWCPDTTAEEVRTKRVRTSGTPSGEFKDKDSVPFGPHPRCMITGCVSPEVEPCYILPPDMPQQLIDCTTFGMRTDYNTFRCNMRANIIFLRRDLRELWETNRLLMIPHPDHLENLESCPVYRYHVIAEDEHPSHSCTSTGSAMTPSVMIAPCSYRSLGWHESSANLHLMILRAGQKLNKRPFHYQHILRDLLPQKEVNHAYSIIQLHTSWTCPFAEGTLHDRRLWATGEPADFPDDYFDFPPKKRYCSPLSDDDSIRFPRGAPVAESGGIARTAKERAKWEASIRQWFRGCELHEWATGPFAEPKDTTLVEYRREEAGSVSAVIEELWMSEYYYSRYVPWWIWMSQL
ncbi:hypothetical protein IEO21_09475 [Rhodonia placenta]|uniref:HNH nuclease domain-containing protein n=1 Tax=Rhodonia placenta TaxID=104341 RepID=A0A8H7NUB2_9APHY|nr:hypothetical protein IEO21_09475 [Postia placenta]